MLRSLLIALAVLFAHACSSVASDSPTRLTKEGNASMHESCRAEVVQLHAFFEAWFLGELEQTDEAFERFAVALADEFVMVSPGGVAFSRLEILDRVRGAHGSAAVGSGPAMKVYTRAEQVRTIGDGLFLVTYEEWQAEGGVERGRISSALLRARPGTPNGVEWIHLHETWLE
ncbi:MAG: hypothetical protein ACI8QZ_001439 [Chlamydiales bacterium]|jgi:hypothetical protein